jgi:hypothetical protein
MTRAILFAAAMLAGAVGCGAPVVEDAPATSCPPITDPDHQDLVCVRGAWHLYCPRGRADCADPREPACVVGSGLPNYCDAEPAAPGVVE